MPSWGVADAQLVLLGAPVVAQALALVVDGRDVRVLRLDRAPGRVARAVAEHEDERLVSPGASVTLCSRAPQWFCVVALALEPSPRSIATGLLSVRYGPMKLSRSESYDDGVSLDAK